MDRVVSVVYTPDGVLLSFEISGFRVDWGECVFERLSDGFSGTRAVLTAIEGMGSSVGKQSILHVCRREMLRPLRDQILRMSGFEVDSTMETGEALSLYATKAYELVLIDVEEDGIAEAEHLCSEIKTAKRGQVVAFVCNWRVAFLTDCPDEIVRTEFNPKAFVDGVKDILGA